MIGLLWLLLTVAPTPPPEPTYLVERVVTIGKEMRRVTLFRDGIAVVKRRSATGEESLSYKPVGELMRTQMEEAVREIYPDLATFSSMGKGPETGTIEYRLAPPGLPPLSVSVSLAAAPSAAAARLAALLNGLEERVLAGKPPLEDLRAWMPTEGEQVELDDGTVLLIVSVYPNAAGSFTVQVRPTSSPLSSFFDLAELRRRAVRRLPPEQK